MADERLILGLESSCDETAASIVADGRRVLSNVVATQNDLHERYAGVVPEIASRAHVERILPVVRSSLEEADVAWTSIDAIAVGNRPGLIGSLLVGVSAAKALAWSLDRPLVGIDHVIAHLFAGMLDAEPVTWPALGLVVSGGHTSLFHLGGPLDVTPLGRTIDDAVGEAYDKAAAILQLGYPGGPLVDELARDGDETAHDLPVSRLGRESLDFSFSGLKTSLLYAVCGQPTGRGADAKLPRDSSSLSHRQKADFAASFQRAAIKAIMLKLERAFERHPAPTLLVGGGVSANTRLRAELTAFAEASEIDLRLPSLELCLDNAAMIAAMAHDRLEAGEVDDLTLSARPR